MLKQVLLYLQTIKQKSLESRQSLASTGGSDKLANSVFTLAGAVFTHDIFSPIPYYLRVASRQSYNG